MNDLYHGWVGDDILPLNEVDDFATFCNLYCNNIPGYISFMESGGDITSRRTRRLLFTGKFHGTYIKW